MRRAKSYRVNADRVSEVEVVAGLRGVVIERDGVRGVAGIGRQAPSAITQVAVSKCATNTRRVTYPLLPNETGFANQSL